MWHVRLWRGRDRCRSRRANWRVWQRAESVGHVTGGPQGGAGHLAGSDAVSVCVIPSTMTTVAMAM